VNYAGLALIVVGIILFILELKIVSHGLLGIGGTVALLLGSIMLIDTESTLEFASLSLSVVLSTVIFTALFFIFAIGMGIRAQRRKPVTGVEGIVGETGEALTKLNPNGQVRVHGEIWNATSAQGVIAAGSRVTVRGVNDLRLTVGKAE
jgi:membrane-bound serine protease (ClpP class)